MKLGIGYIYTIFRYGYPPAIEDDLRALREIRDLGFHYLEMEGLGPRHTQAVWENRERLRDCLRDNEVIMHNFCAVDPGLVALDDAARNAAYAQFERSVALADYLGADTVHLASYAPPVEYVGRAPYSLDQEYEFGDTFRVRLPPGFSWSRVWDVLVESCGRCADIAARSGKVIIMEPRVGETICSVDSLLRLISDVGRPGFKANFDTAHFSAQRENVVLALAKLEGKFEKIHIADNDPSGTDHLAIGRGSIDWEEFFRVLCRSGFDGYLSLDLGGSSNLAADYAASVRRLEELARLVGFTLER